MRSGEVPLDAELEPSPESDPDPDPAAVIDATVKSVLAQSEQGVLEAGRCLADIVEEARAQVEESRRIAPLIEEKAGDRTIGGAIAEEQAAVQAFVVELTSATSAQMEAAQQAKAMTAEIIELAVDISQIALKSKILSMNAAIESARMGSQGLAMGVIAKQMQQLGSEVRETNIIVTRLAKSLSTLLPTIEQLASASSAASQGFSKDIAVRQLAMEKSLGTLVASFRALLASGDKRVTRILGESQRALSALQFHDVIAPQLRELADAVREANASDRVGSTDTGRPKEEGETKTPSSPPLSSGDVLFF